MKAMQREFKTREGMHIELIGASTKVGIWINGSFYAFVAGLHAARRVALSYSKRHAK
jgi:hypothetical protein